MKKPKVDRGTSSGHAQLEELVTLTAKLSLQTAATTRRLAGEVETVVLIPLSAGPAVDMLATGLMYHEGKKDKPSQWQGAPHQYVWAALIKALLAESKVSEKNKEVLRRHASKVKNPEELVPLLPTCIAKKTRDQQFVKVLQTAKMLDPVLAAVVASLEDLGGRAMFGAAPRSGLERAIGGFLQRSGAFERPA